MKERRREVNDDGQDAFLSAAILAFLHPFGGISDRPGDGVVAFVQGSEEKTVYCFALAAPVALPDRFGHGSLCADLFFDRADRIGRPAAGAHAGALLRRLYGLGAVRSADRKSAHPEIRGAGSRI